MAIHRKYDHVRDDDDKYKAIKVGVISMHLELSTRVEQEVDQK